MQVTGITTFPDEDRIRFVLVVDNKERVIDINSHNLAEILVDAAENNRVFWRR